MRFMVYFEFAADDIHKAIKKYLEYEKEMEKAPEKYPKTILPNHVTLDKFGGYSLIEATAEQLGRQQNYFGSLIQYKYIPVLEGSKAMAISAETK